MSLSLIQRKKEGDSTTSLYLLNENKRNFKILDKITDEAWDV